MEAPPWGGRGSRRAPLRSLPRYIDRAHVRTAPARDLLAVSAHACPAAYLPRRRPRIAPPDRGARSWRGPTAHVPAPDPLESLLAPSQGSPPPLGARVPPLPVPCRAVGADGRQQYGAVLP